METIVALSFYATLILCSIFPNTLVIIILTKSRSVFEQDIFHISLAVANLLESTVAFIPTAVSIASNGSMVYDLTCVSTGFLTSFLAYTSILHLTIMSIDRAIALGTPFYYAWLKSLGYSKKLILPLIWILTFFVGILPFFGWSSYTLQKDHGRCSINWTDSSLSGISYIVMLFITFFLLPIVVMVMMCFVVNDAMQKMYLRATNALGYKHRDSIQILKGKSRNNKIIAAMSTSFLAAWTPYATCAIMMTFGFDVDETLLGVSGCLGKTAVIFNPIIYILGSRRFLSAIKNIWIKSKTQRCEYGNV